MPDQPVPTYRDLVRATAKKWKVPEALALAVVDQESRGTHQPAGGGVTTSPQGARGLFQLLPSTAYGEFGLNPDDPAQNIEAGIRYLRQGIEKTGGDTRATLAYYHGGPDLKMHGPKTQAYVDAIMGAAGPTRGGGPGPAAAQTAPGAVTPPATTTPAAPGAPPPAPPGVLAEMQQRMLGSVKDFATEAVKSVNPMEVGRAAKAMFEAGPHGVAQGLWEAHKGDELLAGHPSIANIPMIGPRLAEAEEFREKGEYARAAGAVADVGVSVLGPKAIGKGGRVRVAPRLFKPELNAAEDAAVAFGQQRRVPIDVATASGDPFALKLERATEATARGSKVARRVERTREEMLPAIGEEIAGRVHPTPTTPGQAGERLQAGMERFVQARHQDANAAYDAARAIEADPANVRSVQIGTTNQWTPQGTLQTVPIMAPMNLPADVRAAKAALRPLVDDLVRQMPVTQAQASPGLRALQNIVDGPDFMPTLQLERDLGAIKQVARVGDDQLRNASQGLAARAVQELERAVDAGLATAGPQARQLLDRGRRATTLKHAADDIFQQLADEPVGAFRKATAPKDANLTYLQELRRYAPQDIAPLGRAVLEDIFSIATREGGWDNAGQMFGKWKQLGPETRKLLFGANAAELDNFFMLSKMLSRTPNPSGTALTLTATGSLWNAVRHPLTGIPALFAAGTIAKVMNAPGGVRWLTRGLTIPAAGPRAVAWLAQGTRLLGTEVVQELQGAPPAPPTTPAPQARGRGAAPPPRPPREERAKKVAAGA